MDDAPHEGAFGWLRLALGAFAVGFLPGWALLTAILLQLNPTLREMPFGWAVAVGGGATAVMFVPALGVVVLFSLGVRAAWGAWHARGVRQDRARWSEVVGDGAVLTEDGWQSVDVAPEDPPEPEGRSAEP